MRVFKVKFTILGINDVPETRHERIIAIDLTGVFEILAEVCRNGGSGDVITHASIESSEDLPFGWETKVK